MPAALVAWVSLWCTDYTTTTSDIFGHAITQQTQTKAKCITVKKKNPVFLFVFFHLIYYWTNVSLRTKQNIPTCEIYQDVFVDSNSSRSWFSMSFNQKQLDLLTGLYWWPQLDILMKEWHKGVEKWTELHRIMIYSLFNWKPTCEKLLLEALNWYLVHICSVKLFSIITIFSFLKVNYLSLNFTSHLALTVVRRFL